MFIFKIKRIAESLSHSLSVSDSLCCMYILYIYYILSVFPRVFHMDTKENRRLQEITFLLKF